MAEHAPKLVGLLVRTPAGVDPRDRLAARKLDAEPVLDVAEGEGLGAAGGARWWRVELPDRLGVGDANPWDVAHDRAAVLGLDGGDLFVEPDLEQRFPAFPEELGLAGGPKARPGAEDPPDPRFPPREQDAPFAWHLGGDFSQLAVAREQVPEEAQRAIRIAHLDTGYDPRHLTRPRNLNEDLAWSFVEKRKGAQDPGAGGPLRNPGHGTGTLGILAGQGVPGHVDSAGKPYVIGGIPFAEVVPYRIATSVVLFRTSALAQAIGAALTLPPRDGPPVDVITLSMGGLASQAWAEAVNQAYERGVCLVAAAGNNISTGVFPFPTGLIVYPARFRRVIAACGVMADLRPYADRPAGQMQGNHGPASKMATALSAFTPNTPWAELGAPEVVDLDGAGTSSATPQIASAAGLWLARHRAELKDLPGWQRVEAVRWALFTSANRSADGGKPDRLGNGLLRAADALAKGVSGQLVRTPADSASLALLRLFTGLGAAPSAEREMLALEATQLVQQGYRGKDDDPVVFEQIVDDPDVAESAVPAPRRERLLEALLEHPRASRALRARLAAVLGRAEAPKRAPGPKGRGKGKGRAGPAAEAAPAPAARAPAAARPSEARERAPWVSRPVSRKLRVYAFDPSLQLRLDTAPISAITISVPWEENLSKGPVGEYLEVIDLDPSSQCLYPPVDLDDRAVLAQTGLAPSEANPQFHQQMVYAVASRTIRNFEQALGRKALWAPRRIPGSRDDSQYVQRLRIHPHALREANAYYSPNKVALLFGYFHASRDAPGKHLPGGLVFTCLSHDIVAHETAHALLDGMHRRLVHATNPDMRAFHEAFADVVALLQHFTYPEILKHQISRTRGQIRQQANLLGQLATQFGETTGLRGALRDYIGTWNDEAKRWEPHEASPEDYAEATEPHERGAVLVAAVFDAFLAIYEARTRDLIRLATGGSGELPPGAIHPDLVNRLAQEARKSADHVLTMCVRALDYCPPVDLTFGEYLRALLTADRDLVHDDDLGYRVAFMDAFRRRGIYPDGIRVLSEESLVWRGPANDELRPSPQLLACFGLLQDYTPRIQRAGTREDLFHLSREMRARLHQRLKEHLETAATAEDDANYLGIEVGRRFEVHSARLASRVGPDGQLLPQFVVEILQRKPMDEPGGGGGGGGGATAGPQFEGGAAVVVDVQSLGVRYAIRKRVRSTTRLERQRAFMEAFVPAWDTYLARFANDEPFAFAHR